MYFRISVNGPATSKKNFTAKFRCEVFRRSVNISLSYIYRSACLQNLMRYLSTFCSLIWFILLFTDLQNFTYRKKFPLQEVKVLQKLAKKDGKKEYSI